MEEISKGIGAETKAKGSYLNAVVLSVGYGLIGVVAWVLIGAYANFISAWIAFGIAIGIRYGYDKVNGPKKGRSAIIVSIYLVQVFVAVYLMYYLAILTFVNIGFFDLIPILADPAMQTPEIITEYVLICVFSLIGLVFLFLNYRSLTKQNKVISGEMSATKGDRFERTILFSGDYYFTAARLGEALAKNKYTPQKYGEEDWFRQGDGVWSASKFVRFAQVEGGIKLEAFILINNKEHGTEGFYGAAAKLPLKKVVAELIGIIENK